MKHYVKVSILIMFILLSAVFVYPLVHEAGHIVTIVLFSGKVTHLSLFPEVFTECEVKNCSLISIFCISLSGHFLPFAVSILPYSKNPVLRFVQFSFCYVTLIYLLFFIINILLSIGGYAVNENDLNNLNLRYQSVVPVALIVVMSQSVVLIIKSVKSKPCSTIVELIKIATREKIV